jgi:hypothetical protein
MLTLENLWGSKGRQNWQVKKVQNSKTAQIFYKETIIHNMPERRQSGTLNYIF